MSIQIIYKHIPRTAGTSLKEILPDETFVLGHDYYGDGYKHLYYHLKPYLKRFVLSFVRNPYDRAVSAFFYLNAGGNNPNDEIEKERYIAKYNDDFNAFVKNAFPGIRTQIHFMPQHHWICGNNYKDLINLCNYVGKFETIDDDLKELSKIIPLKSIELPERNKSEHSQYEDYYTTETKKIIYNNYIEDFKLFGYEE